MGNDLIALIVAVVLAIVVVGFGWRRDLAASTRNWLPLFEEKRAVAPPLPVDRWRRSQPSPREKRWIAGGNVVFGLFNAAIAVFWASDRLFHALIAGGLALSAVFWLKRSTSEKIIGSKGSP